MISAVCPVRRGHIFFAVDLCLFPSFSLSEGHQTGLGGIGKLDSRSILPEMLKAHGGWWAPLLAHWFTHINHFPVCWSEALVQPAFKNGEECLLSLVAKLYASSLNQKLGSWIGDQNILGNEQTGFRKDQSTIDHCILLSHLAEKYMTSYGNGLFTAFIYLKSAFDSIPRDKLWIKLCNTPISKRLLYLIKCLHQGTTLRTRCGREGELAKSLLFPSLL